jgi:hypothetical protein
MLAIVSFAFRLIDGSEAPAITKALFNSKQNDQKPFRFMRRGSECSNAAISIHPRQTMNAVDEIHQHDPEASNFFTIDLSFDSRTKAFSFHSVSIMKAKIFECPSKQSKSSWRLAHFAPVRCNLVFNCIIPTTQVSVCALRF